MSEKMDKLDGLVTNHNLDGDAAQRARPKKGVWGPDRVPSRLLKNIMRIAVPIVFIIIVAVLFWVGVMFFDALH